MTDTTNTQIDLCGAVELEYFLGEFYEEIIELEWNMTPCEFLNMFWDKEKEEFTI